ncbi:MAG: hypothetical protein QG641_1162, partial [Candidatus Poribacteria bacterium]|nr:hypothetical protein [Candidatus Poribacteria bacterium]
LREYDQQGRWLAAVNPLGNKWIFDYDTQGNLIRINNPKSAFRNLTYSENGVLIETSDWDGNLTKFAVDHFGRVTQRIDCLNNVTTFRYDLLENLIGIVFPDNSQIFCQYDSGRNLTSVTNCNGNTIKFFFGTCGRLLERTDPLGDTVKYIWGTEPNRLEKVINEKGESHTFVYNEIDKIIQETCFDGRTLTFEYDIAGRCIATINGLGERISYEYDPLGRLIKKLLPDGTSASFEYDIHGNIISAANKSCEVKIERDLLGRIIKEYQDKCIIEYEYDAVGNTTHTKTSLGHEVYYEYDSRSYLSSLKTNGDHLMSFKHNNVGREIQRLLPGGIELKQEYDFNGQMLEQLVSITEQQFSTSDQLNSDVKPIRPSEDTIIHRAYQYDKAGNLVSIDDNRCGISHYIYDPAERLIQAIREKTSEVFSYDKTGNIIKDGESEELQYGPGNRLLRQGNTKHIYDDNSRLVKKIEDSETGKSREWIYQWDGDDQLVSMTDPNGNKWEYIYDPFGRRISKKGPERTTYYIWDKNVIIHQLEHDNLEATWIFDPRSFKPFAKIERDSIYPVITDHLGTPRELVDNQGKIVWSASYKAWGENDEISINKVDCPIRFPGQWADEESGLCYSWFRYYDPTNGHFLCSDPIGLNGGLNEFLYATNPINWIDPLGLNGCGDDDEEPVTIVISRSKYPEAAQHIDDNSPVTGRIDRPGASDRRRESLRGIETTPGMDRDEVPPAVLSTGGAGASVRHIPSSDNRGAGSSMGQQMRDLPNGTLVSIISGD